MNPKDRFKPVYRVDDVIHSFNDRIITTDEQEEYSTRDDIMKLKQALDRLEEFRMLYFILEHSEISGKSFKTTATNLDGPHPIPPASSDENNICYKIIRSSEVPLNFIPIEERVSSLMTDHTNVNYINSSFLQLYETAKEIVINELRRILKELRTETIPPYTILEGLHTQGVVRFSYYNDPANLDADHALILHVFGKKNFTAQLFDKVRVQDWPAMQQIVQSDRGLLTRISGGFAYKFPSLVHEDLDNLSSVRGLILP